MFIHEMMQKILFSLIMLLFAVLESPAQQTIRKFTLPLAGGGQSELTCYLPQMATGRAVVDCPGTDASQKLSMEQEGNMWADYFNKQGIAYFVLKYRLSQGNMEQSLNDAYQAMRLVRDSASVWSINPRNVGIMGFSTGGHLASLVSALAPYDARPNFSILFYPVIAKAPIESDKVIRAHLTPPSVIFLSNDDEVVSPISNGLAYYANMHNLGNDCELHVYPSGGHGWGFSQAFKHRGQMLNDLTAWLKTFDVPEENALRIACIGNSITDGCGIKNADSKGYPAVLQRLLGNQYNVKNFGVSARTMMNKGDWPYMRELAWRDAQAFLPNIVVIKLGTNDSKPENWVHGVGEYMASMQAMLDTLKALPSKPKIYLCSPIPAFKPTWNINDSIIRNEEMAVIKKLAKKYKTGFIDLHSLYTYRDLMLDDGIHPNGRGAEKLVGIIYDALMKDFDSLFSKSRK